MLIAITVSVLFCGIVAAELPELLSLGDNTSNDFTICKAGSAECASMLSAVNSGPIRLNLEDSECGTRIRWAATVEGKKRKSSDLFVLHSVLRR